MEFIEITDEKLKEKILFIPENTIIDDKMYKVFYNMEITSKQLLAIANFVDDNKDLDIVNVHNAFYIQRKFEEAILDERIKKYSKEHGLIRRYGITMEYLENYINLEEYLKEKNINSVIDIFFKIGNSLKELNRRNAAHTDPHSCNIMVNKDADIKLIDIKWIGLKDILTKEEYDESLWLQNNVFIMTILNNLYGDELDRKLPFFEEPFVDNIKSLTMSSELKDYITSVGNGEVTKTLITDFKDDFAPDLVEYNRKKMYSIYKI